MTTRCKYSCAVCSLHRVPLDVPAREAESVTDWMTATVQLVANDHQRRSPGCPAKELTELMIPMSGTDRVGGPVVQ